MNRSERLVAIALLLQTRGKLTAERLAGILGVSTRTIYRDMDSLSLAHVPVSMDHGPGGGYFLAEGYRLDATTFTGEEAAALALGGMFTGGVRLLGGGPLQRALVKLEATLPEAYRADVRAARERILFDEPAWYRRAARAEHLEPLRLAVWNGRQVDLLYRRSDGFGTEWRRVEPQGLVSKAAIWYLVAYCHARQDFRTFRLDRIQDVHMREEPVADRREFDLTRYWEEQRQRFERLTTPFSLTLRVAASVLARVAGDGEVVRQQPDGWFVLTVHLESEEEAVSYSLALGPNAIVLDPAEVRDEVRAAARALLGHYGNAD
jgi:predicted DNA-binding transcriptional regulator YafY